MLQQFGDEIWIAEGADIEAIMGFRYPLRMAVMRLADGGLLVWSPVGLTDTLHAQVNALGPVRHIVAPNTLHHLYIPEWKNAFPEAKLHAAPGLPEKRKDIAFDEILGDAPPPGWVGEIDQLVMKNAIADEVVFFHVKSGTVLFTDLIQHFPRGWFRGWRAIVAKLDLMTGPEPAVPRKFRLAVRDRPAARAALARILAWPAQNVVMAHGTPVTGEGRAFLGRAFRWLQPS
ncbi:DUF4336 domain-containing protein [Parvibaculum sp.]|jgi:hypothetical protein|uniref:DUF4336 domain-containing protein n=1 Tax=Parvibaculum sp. TaxID=2024848 RepID=UPI000C5F7FF5|nr:DUF4336 domain-containing protein [Parvibaculum sp.]MAM94112.1 hypothetical protein [Parvibaculum sp.]HCX68831.1 hypothetical protein [Rhodobiaceae bacterium]|tara:strand:- start:5833 stop:6525 length:693 start_codon:yes stop_codon:yes gene_type:complete